MIINLRSVPCSFKNLVLSKATDKVAGKEICTIVGINNVLLRKQSYYGEALSFVLMVFCLSNLVKERPCIRITRL